MSADRKQIENEAARWIARDNGDWTPGQQRALDAWLNADTAHRVAFLRLQTLWNTLDGLREAEHSRRHNP